MENLRLIKAAKKLNLIEFKVNEQSASDKMKRDNRAQFILEDFFFFFEENSTFGNYFSTEFQN